MKKYLLLLFILAFSVPAVYAQTEKEERLYIAIATNDTANVRLVLAEGADAGATIKMNRGGAHLTMLVAAVMNGNAAVVRELLARKPNLEKKDSFGSTPLMYAAGAGNLEITKMLIDAGADVNADDGKGLTVLKAAQDSKNAEVIALIESKMDK